MMMEKEKLEKIAEQLAELKRYEWNRIQMVVDQHFNQEANRLKIEDPGLLKHRLQREFDLASYGDSKKSTDKRSIRNDRN